MVKTGTEALSCADGSPNVAFLQPFTEQIARLRLDGHRVIVVSSGAVGIGRALMGEEGWQKDPAHLLEDKAAAAAFGQTSLIETYKKHFRKAGISLCAQVLVRNDDFSNGHVGARKNILATLKRVYAFPRAIAIFNENDVVSYDENKPLCAEDPETFSDNDGLNSLLGRLVRADLSLTVSTHPVFTKNPSDPEAALVSYINYASDKYSLSGLGISTEGTSCAGRGGMGNKLAQVQAFVQAGTCGARQAYIIGADEVAADGLLRAARGEAVGTRLVCFRPDAGNERSAACNACLR